MRTILAFLCFMTVAGCYQPQVYIPFFAHCGGGGTGGEGGTAPGGGDTGGMLGLAPDCSDPLLGYDPASNPFGPLVPLPVEIDGIVASVLPPFSTPTACETVIVGLAVGPAPCEVPSAIDVVTFDTLLPLIPDGVAGITTVPVSGPLFPTSDPAIFEVRLPVHSEHTPELYPFVGAIVRENFCPAVMPSCDPARAMRYRPVPEGKGWHLLSEDLPDEPGTDGALYFGLADCGGL